MLTKAAGMPVGKGGSYDWNALVKEAGLCVTSIHEDLGTIRREPETVAKEAEAFGTKYVVITGMYRFDYSDKAAVQGLCRYKKTSPSRYSFSEVIHCFLNSSICISILILPSPALSDPCV